MNNDNAELLEGMISSFINRKYVDVPPTEDEFNEEAETIRNSNSSFLPISDTEFDELKKRLRQTIIVTLDTGICLVDKRNGHESWLPGRKADLDFFFWNRYKKYLEEAKGWNPRVTAKLGQVSDEILDHCGNPAGGLIPHPWSCAWRRSIRKDGKLYGIGKQGC